MPPLENTRHELFAQALAKGKTAFEAYSAAGYEPDRGNAIRLTANDSIQTRVAEIVAKGAERAEITVEKVFRELAKIGFADIRKLVKWQGTLVTEEDNPDGGEILVIKSIVTNHVQLISSDEIDDDTAAAISEVSMSKEGALKVKLIDKKGALELLGKELGMFVERAEIVNIHHEVSPELPTADEWAREHATEH